MIETSRWHMTPELTTLERHEELEQLRREWEAVSASSRNVFATYEFNELWWQHFGGGGRLLAYACRDSGGAARAILPLYLWRPTPRVARFLGHGAGDELGPIVGDPSDRALVAAALLRALSDARCTALLAEHLPGDASWTRLLRGRLLRREGSPIVDLRGRDWDGVLAGLSSNVRNRFRRLERKLAREEGLSYRLTSDAEELERDLDTLFALHRKRWRKRTNFSDREAFHRDFARLAFERGWLRLWSLELQGQPAAAWLGYRVHGAELYYQAGRDPAWDKMSVGLVLLMHSLRAAIADGALEYRFLRGDEAFKYRLGGDETFLETSIVAQGTLRPAVFAGASAALGARRAARRLRQSQPG